MSRYFFEISYQGSPFDGWQRQKNTDNTIQQFIETALEKILRKPAPVVSCGRTDKGVHAYSFFFHLDADIQDQEKLIYKLNRMTGSNILFKSVHKVHDKAHARFDAVERTYLYRCHFGKNPFLDKLSLELSIIPDFKLIREALEVLPGISDFRNFCKSPGRHKSTICRITRVPELIELDSNSFAIRISANRFLKCMIRILIDKLIKVGSGQMSKETFVSMFAMDEREGIIGMADPSGLYLESVSYNFPLE